MPRCWSWVLLGAVAACEGGQTGTPTSDDGRDLDASVVITCTNDPDAATALGVRGADLWAAFDGTYTLEANRPTRGENFDVATFTLTVARSTEPAPGLDDCTEVAVPVRVTVQSAAPAVNETIAGVLRGSLLSADIAFATPEYLLGFEPRIYGSLLFSQGQPLQMSLRTDGDGRWTAPPLQVTP